MAVGTDGAHAGAVAVMDGLLVFLIDVVAHLVTADAELQVLVASIAGVESTPEEDAGPKKPTTRMLSSEYFALGRRSIARKPFFHCHP
jgi:hypothetical protein